MIYTITINPAIDYVMHTEQVREGGTNRSIGEEIYFGGKGVNVSTVLSRLGGETTALGFVAGFTGLALADALRNAGVNADFIPLEKGMTRINVKLMGESVTEINAQGPEISSNALEKLMEKLSLLRAGDTLVLAGSVPASLPRDIYRQMLEKVAHTGVRTVVDAAGELLLAVLPYKPFLVKPNLHELEEVVGRPLPDDAAIEKAARELQGKGARNVLVSLGGNGALLVDELGNTHRHKALGDRPVNTVGAGDSMVAGFLMGCERGYDYALKLGVAAGGATACSKGLATREEIEELLRGTF